MIGFIRNLKLSVSQWLAATAALVIGLLVVALKVQGSRLHRAQLDVLKVTLKPREDAAEGASITALARYDRAKEAFVKAGGKLP